MANASADLDSTQFICEWITITAPESIHDLAHKDGQAWLGILRVLEDRQIYEGSEVCEWDHVNEDRSQVYIWSSWNRKTYYDEHKGTAAYHELYEKLGKLCRLKFIPKIVGHDSRCMYARGGYDESWPSITLVHFDHVFTHAQREEVQQIRHITWSGSWGSCFVNSPSTTGFLLQDAENLDGGPSNDVYMILDRWRRPVHEEGVRNQYEVGFQVSDDPRHVVPPWFADAFAAQGCTRIEITHVCLDRVIPSCVEYFPDEVIKTKSHEYDWERGRRCQT
ncbi:hypothetical protein CC86DRAFT_462921 [Ophiobolus disseminans]|uniref:ABM domain-containing protein n=1 Tax=Ophiobolus disseminans TaxID=1469910 RepID=A0A6A7AIC5_9PLEO|nr:hypothetical protein CC86DRAFT_462921 [Ophiobolus disseminans]